MRAFLSIASLLIVLAVVAISVRNQLQASKRLLPSAATAADASSAPFGGSSSPGVAQYQRELDKAIKADVRHTDDAASAAEDGAR